jgi:membrane protein DedA with SNARE-associated domain
MSIELAKYITEYGYLAIFGLVFLQEVGVPNPVPNEIVLLFSGYLAWQGILSFPLVLLAAIFADFIGTTLLYTVFYLFGNYLLNKKPSWIPISHERIKKLSDKLSGENKWSLYFGRLIPYARGYVSVTAGLLKIKPMTFLMTVFLSAVTWTGGYVILGRILGKYWQNVAGAIGGLENGIIVLVIITILILIHKYLDKSTSEENTGNK